MKYDIVLNPTNEDIKNIYELDKKFYKDEYLWDREYQMKIFNINRESFILVKDSERVIGYLNYLCITKEKYNQMKNAITTIDEFEEDEIIPFKVGKNYITINSIVIDKEYQNKGILKRINDSFLEKMKELNNKNIEIIAINGIAISSDGQKYFEDLNFIKFKEFQDKNVLFILEKDVIEKLEKAMKLLKNKKK